MNYLLDTNIVSELQKSTPNPLVDRWRRTVRPGATHLSALVLGEVRQGVERVRRKNTTRANDLEQWLNGLEVAFIGKVLPVTAEIAEEWGRMSVPDPIPAIDGLMAATAKVHGMTFVTRNVKGVSRTGVTILNPFEPQS